MPRKAGKGANNAGSIRQRPDGRWEGRVTVGVNPATGKPVRRSIYGTTQREVRQQITAILNDLDRGTYQAPNKMTVSEWMQEWLRTFCSSKVKPLTLATYEGMVRNHITPRIGGIQLQALRGHHVQSIYNAMIDGGSSPKTVKNAAAVLHKALDVAVKQGLISINPCDGAELPKAQKHEIHPLTDEEIPQFLAAIEGSPYRNAYALCLFAGLREGECLGLAWPQVDFKQGRITVSQQLQREKKRGGKHYIAPSTKSGKPRTVQLPAIALRYLKDEQTTQFQNRLKAGPAWSNKDDLVFTNELGEHLAIISFYRHFKQIAASIGRPDARPHDLRHTAATVAIASGADIKSVQSLLGHATASFTLDVYAHASEKMMQDTAARMQSYYDGLQMRK